MHDSTSILNILLKSIFVGFGFVIPIVTLLKTSNLIKLKFKDLFILTAVQTVRLAGIIYFLLFLLKTYSKPDYGAFKGSFLVFYWYSPLIYLIVSQVYWLKKSYMSKPALVTFAISLFILPSELLKMQVWRYIHEYGSLMLNFSAFPNLIIDFILNVIVFIFIIITLMLAGNKFKQIKQ